MSYKFMSKKAQKVLLDAFVKAFEDAEKQGYDVRNIFKKDLEKHPIISSNHNGNYEYENYLSCKYNMYVEDSVVYHYRHKQIVAGICDYKLRNYHKGGITIVGIKYKGIWHYGVSFCSIEDNFVKSVGRDVGESRAISLIKKDKKEFKYSFWDITLFNKEEAYNAVRDKYEKYFSNIGLFY